jgi:hypothetical protein
MLGPSAQTIFQFDLYGLSSCSEYRFCNFNLWSHSGLSGSAKSKKNDHGFLSKNRFSLFPDRISGVISIDMEYNLVEVWLRRDPVRWLSGALGGLVAAAAAMLLAMLMATSLGMEAWFPIKLIGTIILGPTSTEIGASMAGVIAGGILFEVLGLIFGIIFAHFTGTNSVGALLAMGLVWGIFSWIFIWNLFMQSFKPINAIKIPSGAALPVCLAYGISLVTVSFFDRMLRGKRS